MNGAVWKQTAFFVLAHIVFSKQTLMLTFAKIFLNMLRAFKYVAMIEGISAIALFFVAMPLKYIWGNDQLIRPIGMAHGVLFCIYIAFAIACKVQYKWDWKKFIIICLASIPPFGTFYIERKYLKPQQVN